MHLNYKSYATKYSSERPCWQLVIERFCKQRCFLKVMQLQREEIIPKKPAQSVMMQDWARQ